jgi:hypothetical protein
MTDEILLQLWKEQCSNARRYIRDSIRKRTDRGRFRAEGVSLMLLSLKDALLGLSLSKAVKQQVEADCKTVLDLLTQL